MRMMCATAPLPKCRCPLDTSSLVSWTVQHTGTHLLFSCTPSSTRSCHAVVTHARIADTHAHDFPQHHPAPWQNFATFVTTSVRHMHRQLPPLDLPSARVPRGTGQQHL